MTKPTQLAQRLLAAAVVCIALKLSSCTSTLCAFIIFTALATLAVVLRPRDPSMTILDKFMMNIDRACQQASGPCHGHVVAVLDLEPNTQVDLAAAVAHATAFAQAHPRMRSFAARASPALGSSWEEVPGDYDFTPHVTQRAFSSDAQVDAEIEELTNTPLPLDRPLWAWSLLHIPWHQGQRRSTCRSVALLRINHCIGDGLRLAMAGGMFTFADDGTNAVPALIAKMIAKKKGPASSASKRPSLLNLARDFLAAATMDKLPSEPASCLHPTPDAVFPPAARRVLASSIVSFGDVKTIRKACPAGTSINDVVLTAFCAALTRYVQRVTPDAPVSDLLVRALCAVALPGGGRGMESRLFNNIILPSMPLCVGTRYGSRLERLEAVRGVMARVKTSAVGSIAVWLNSVLMALGLEELAGATNVRIFGKHSFVYSNVPAFARTVRIFGDYDVAQFRAWYPNMISQTVFVSYRDTLSFSLVTEPVAGLAQPQLLTDLFAEEVRQWAEEG